MPTKKPKTSFSKKIAGAGLNPVPNSLLHTYEADVIVMKKPKSLRLHVSKNRYGTPGDKSCSEAIELLLYRNTIKETIEILVEVIARKKFGGITKMFEEGMKIQLKKEINKLVLE